MTDRPRLLLADSDPEVQLVVPPFMKRVGDVLIAKTAEQSLELLRSELVHILLISGELLATAGEQIIIRLRDREPHAQVMVLCERHTTNLPTWLLAEGVGDVLVKPFDVADLPSRIEKLQDVLNERRRRAHLQQELETRIRHSDRVALLGTLVATVAHEVANPLSVVVTNAAFMSEMLQEGGPKTPRDREFLEASTTDTLASANIIKDYLSRILQFSRQECNGCDIDLADTLKTALLFVRNRTRDQNVCIHIDDSLSRPLTPIPHHAAAFAQAVVNTLSNAIDAAGRDGNVWLRVEEMRQDERDWLIVVVTDDGPGMTTTELARLCEPFFTTKKTGTGLGTVVIKQVMHEHGGRAEWKCLESGGVEVRLVLPRRRAPRL